MARPPETLEITAVSGRQGSHGRGERIEHPGWTRPGGRWLHRERRPRPLTSYPLGRKRLVPTLTTASVARLLGSTLATIEAELGALPEAVGAWHPAPGEWCINETLGHLIEAERRGFAGRVRAILEAEAEPELDNWDQAAVARARRDCEQPAPALVREFVELRRASIPLVVGLRAPDLERGGRHPEVGRLTVGELLHEWVHHDRNHVRQLLGNVQAYVWPAMGNAQRFSRSSTTSSAEE
jgi:DinB superfamily